MAPPVIPPAGTSAASFFTENIIDPAKPAAILADDIDYSTGDLNTILSGVHPIDAAFADQFKIQRGSGASVMEQGNDFHKIKKNLESTPRALRQEVDRIAAPFVARGDIRLDEVIAEAVTDTGEVVVSYINLRTQKAEKVRAGT